jgi:hypothetical protein
MENVCLSGRQKKKEAAERVRDMMKQVIRFLAIFTFTIHTHSRLRLSIGSPERKDVPYKLQGRLCANRKRNCNVSVLKVTALSRDEV